MTKSPRIRNSPDTSAVFSAMLREGDLFVETRRAGGWQHVRNSPLGAGVTLDTSLLKTSEIHASKDRQQHPTTGLDRSTQSVSQSLAHYHTPSRELMAHTLTLLTRVRVRLVSLDQEILVEGDVFNLLRTCASS